MSQVKPKLFQYTVCPFCIKVRNLLHYKKIPFEAVEVHPLNKKEIAFSEDYKKVPIFLGADGVKQINSTDIMRHIDRTWPEKPVFETEEPMKSLEEKWLLWSDQELVQALPPVMYRTIGDALRAFSYISKIGRYSRFDRFKIKYAGAIVMMIISRKRRKQRGISDPKTHLKNKLAEWESALDGKPFLNGKHPNGADFAVHGVLSSIEELPSFHSVRENSKVSLWFDEMKEVIRSSR